jgi:hypothetical protein
MRLSHPAVPHRDSLLKRPTTVLSRFNEWSIDHLARVLGSSFGVWVAFAIPLLAFGVHPLLIVLGLVSSYWIQLWALFVLQKSSNRDALKSSAKAEADHMAMTHIALQVDAIMAKIGESDADNRK